MGRYGTVRLTPPASAPFARLTDIFDEANLVREFARHRLVAEWLPNIQQSFPNLQKLQEAVDDAREESDFDDFCGRRPATSRGPSSRRT